MKVTIKDDILPEVELTLEQAQWNVRLKNIAFVIVLVVTVVLSIWIAINPVAVLARIFLIIYLWFGVFLVGEGLNKIFRSYEDFISESARIAAIEELSERLIKARHATNDARWQEEKTPTGWAFYKRKGE